MTKTTTFFLRILFKQLRACDVFFIESINSNYIHLKYCRSLLREMYKNFKIDYLQKIILNRVFFADDIIFNK